jgi:hypothetical protein
MCVSWPSAASMTLKARGLPGGFFDTVMFFISCDNNHYMATGTGHEGLGVHVGRAADCVPMTRPVLLAHAVVVAAVHLVFSPALGGRLSIIQERTRIGSTSKAPGGGLPSRAQLSAVSMKLA